MDRSDDELREQFETVYQHLELVDQRLQSMADEIQTAVDESISDTSVDVEYSLRDGVFTAEIPRAEVVRRLNTKLEPPAMAKWKGDTIQIIDIRDEFDFDISDVHGSSRDRVKVTKQIIDSLDKGDTGAAESDVRLYLEFIGLDKDAIDNVIDGLTSKGDVYRPAAEYLRVV